VGTAAVATKGIDDTVAKVTEFLEILREWPSLLNFRNFQKISTAMRVILPALFF
jgi:hypothetical protein